MVTALVEVGNDERAVGVKLSPVTVVILVTDLISPSDGYGSPGENSREVFCAQASCWSNVNVAF